MISRRSWIIRCAIVGLVLYICTHISIKTGASDYIKELQQSGRNLAALDTQPQQSPSQSQTLQQQQQQQQPADKLQTPLIFVELNSAGIAGADDDNKNSAKLDNNLYIVEPPHQQPQPPPFIITLNETKNNNNNVALPSINNNNIEQIRTFNVEDDAAAIQQHSSNIMKIAPKDLNIDDDTNNNLFKITTNQTANTNNIMISTMKSIKLTNLTNTNMNTNLNPLETETEKSTTLNLNERLKLLLNCHERPMIPRTQQRGDYWVLYNYIRAEERHNCYDSITYTTHADYSFMDNLVPLLERWRGPISVAMHAPGSDFTATLSTIKYLRDCTTPLVKQHVTFHIFFSTKHVPKQVPKHDKVLNEPYNCSLPAPYLNVNVNQMYRTQKKLLYPVNVGRNVARESAQTHFILPSDIELYPSLNLIPDFLEMIAENKGPLLRKNPRVFVLSIFEVASNYSVPDNKTRLKEMLQNGTAIEFHKKVCHMCHKVPKIKEWQAANVTKGLHVFHIGKRTGPYVHWEPVYIGTHADPLYDERLSWEGKSDKMTQGYALCVLDYDFQILDNAFLCHKPGIKTYKKDAKRATLAAKTNQLIRKIIFPELKILYGTRKGCAV